MFNLRTCSSFLETAVGRKQYPPFVVSRKNWLFFSNPECAEAKVLLNILIETAETNNLEPYDDLQYIFARLPWL